MSVYQNAFGTELRDRRITESLYTARYNQDTEKMLKAIEECDVRCSEEEKEYLSGLVPNVFFTQVQETKQHPVLNFLNKKLDAEMINSIPKNASILVIDSSSKFLEQAIKQKSLTSALLLLDTIGNFSPMNMSRVAAKSASPSVNIEEQKLYTTMVNVYCEKIPACIISYRGCNVNIVRDTDLESIAEKRQYPYGFIPNYLVYDYQPTNVLKLMYRVGCFRITYNSFLVPELIYARSWYNSGLDLLFTKQANRTLINHSRYHTLGYTTNTRNFDNWNFCTMHRCVEPEIHSVVEPQTVFDILSLNVMERIVVPGKIEVSNLYAFAGAKYVRLFKIRDFLNYGKFVYYLVSKYHYDRLLKSAEGLTPEAFTPAHIVKVAHSMIEKIVVAHTKIRNAWDISDEDLHETILFVMYHASVDRSEYFQAITQAVRIGKNQNELPFFKCVYDVFNRVKDTLKNTEGRNLRHIISKQIFFQPVIKTIGDVIHMSDISRSFCEDSYSTVPMAPLLPAPEFKKSYTTHIQKHSEVDTYLPVEVNFACSGASMYAIKYCFNQKKGNTFVLKNYVKPNFTRLDACSLSTRNCRMKGCMFSRPVQLTGLNNLVKSSINIDKYRFCCDVHDNLQGDAFGAFMFTHKGDLTPTQFKLRLCIHRCYLNHCCDKPFELSAIQETPEEVKIELAKETVVEAPPPVQNVKSEIKDVERTAIIAAKHPNVPKEFHQYYGFPEDEKDVCVDINGKIHDRCTKGLCKFNGYTIAKAKYYKQELVNHFSMVLEGDEYAMMRKTAKEALEAWVPMEFVGEVHIFNGTFGCVKTDRAVRMIKNLRKRYAVIVPTAFLRQEYLEKVARALGVTVEQVKPHVWTFENALINKISADIVVVDECFRFPVSYLFKYFGSAPKSAFWLFGDMNQVEFCREWNLVQSDERLTTIIHEFTCVSFCNLTFRVGPKIIHITRALGDKSLIHIDSDRDTQVFLWKESDPWPKDFDLALCQSKKSKKYFSDKYGVNPSTYTAGQGASKRIGIVYIGADDVAAHGNLNCKPQIIVGMTRISHEMHLVVSDQLALANISVGRAKLMTLMDQIGVKPFAYDSYLKKTPSNLPPALLSPEQKFSPVVASAVTGVSLDTDSTKEAMVMGTDAPILDSTLYMESVVDQKKELIAMSYDMRDKIQLANSFTQAVTTASHRASTNKIAESIAVKSDPRWSEDKFFQNLKVLIPERESWQVQLNEIGNVMLQKVNAYHTRYGDRAIAGFKDTITAFSFYARGFTKPQARIKSELRAFEMKPGQPIVGMAKELSIYFASYVAQCYDLFYKMVDSKFVFTNTLSKEQIQAQWAMVAQDLVLSMDTVEHDSNQNSRTMAHRMYLMSFILNGDMEQVQAITNFYGQKFDEKNDSGDEYLFHMTFLQEYAMAIKQTKVYTRYMAYNDGTKMGSGFLDTLDGNCLVTLENFLGLVLIATVLLVMLKGDDLTAPMKTRQRILCKDDSDPFGKKDNKSFSAIFPCGLKMVWSGSSVRENPVTEYCHFLMADNIVCYDPNQYLQKVMLKSFPPTVTEGQYKEYRSSVLAAYREHWMENEPKCAAVASLYYKTDMGQMVTTIKELHAFTDLSFKDFLGNVRKNTLFFR